MFEAKGFFDYCIDEKCVENNYESTIKVLFDLGYRTIAINQTVDCNNVESKKKKKKNEVREPQKDPVPDPYKITPVKGCEDLKILNRLTIVFGSQDQLHKITKSPTYKKFHIIGVLPTTSPAFQFICSSFEADIFCFNPEEKNYQKRSRKLYRQLVERGYHFEIPYSPAIEDATKRKNVIHTSHIYHTINKSKNIIISSSATNSSLLRSPYDIINLGLIFGLNEQQAKSAITHCGRQVYINSVGRRHGKAVAFVESVEDKKKIDEDVDATTDVILLESDEEMETDQPALKKIKQ